MNTVKRGIFTGAAAFGFLKAWRQNFRARREAKRTGQAVPVETEGASMDIKAFLVQAIMAVIRHALTAGGLVEVVGSDQSMTQIAGVVALVVGGAWSLYRKWSAAKAKPAA